MVALICKGPQCSKTLIGHGNYSFYYRTCDIFGTIGTVSTCWLKICQNFLKNQKKLLVKFLKNQIFTNPGEREYLKNRPFSAYMEFMGWKYIVMATIWSMKHAWHLLAFWEIQFWSWAKFDNLSTPISPHLDIQETWGNTGFWDIFIYLTFGIIRVIDINYSLDHNKVKCKFF